MPHVQVTSSIRALIGTDVGPDAPLMSCGLDSLGAVELHRSLSRYSCYKLLLGLCLIFGIIVKGRALRAPIGRPLDIVVKQLDKHAGTPQSSTSNQMVPVTAACAFV